MSLSAASGWNWAIRLSQRGTGRGKHLVRITKFNPSRCHVLPPAIDDSRPFRGQWFLLLKAIRKGHGKQGTLATG